MEPSRAEFEKFNALPPELQAAKDKLDKLKQKFTYKTNPDLAEKLHGEIGNFVEKLRETFPDYLEYSAYHILGGSGMHSTAEHLDFGEKVDEETKEVKDYSVINFIDGLEAKITEAK